MKEKTGYLLEDYGTTPVPAEEGQSWFQIGIVYWAVAVCLPAFLLSGIVAGQTRLWTSIAAFIVASAILGAIAAITGIMGAQTKLSTALTARYTFGTYGAYILQIILFFAAWGWFGVQLGFMAEGLGDGGLAFVMGGSVPASVLKIIGGVLMTLTAMFGYKAIEKLSAIAVPLLLVMLLATLFSVYSGGKTITSVAAMATANVMSFGAAVSILIGSFIMGAIIAPDISRYAKSKDAAGLGMVFGMAVGFPVVLILASLMVRGSGEIDFSKVMLSGHSGIWAVMAVLTIVLAAWTTNDNNLYSGALAINAIIPKVHKWVITIFIGALGTVFALLGINTSAGFMTFLNMLAIFIPPAAAVMIIDYLFFSNAANKRYRGEALEELSPFRVVPLICWAVGVAFGFYVQYSPFTLTTITAVDTMIAAAVIYAIIMSLAKNKTTQQDASY